jgi:hypothetical protein
MYAHLGEALHRMTNIVIAEKNGKVTARSYVDGLTMNKDGSVAVHVHSYYDDVLTKTRDGWKLQFRKCTTIYQQGNGLADARATAKAVTAK